jgi:N-acyl-D-amino-acid deacylase
MWLGYMGWCTRTACHEDLALFDALIRGGLVIDGTGAARQRRDVGIEGDRVTAVGDLASASARLVVDAKGKVVTPGFVDPHSHSDWTLQANPGAESTIRQGVTTEVVGNCGISNAPVSDHSEAMVAARLRAYGYPEHPTWRSFAEYLSEVASGGTAQNLAFFVGHSTVRAAAGVGTRSATDDELATMIDYVTEAMEAGAIGVSTGLEYSHGRFAGTNEVASVVSAAARRGGYYASHIRNRDAHLLDATAEFLDVLRSSGAAGQISHLNVREGTGVPPEGWLRAVEMMATARQQGVDVEADATPFQQGLGLMIGLLPDWLLQEGLAAAAVQLSEPAVRDQLRRDCDRYWRFISRGEWQRVRLQSSPQFPDWAGLRFPEIAELAGQDEWDCYFDILAAAGGAMGDLCMVGELFSEEHLADIISHPLFSLGVDSTSSSVRSPLADITPNPLPYRGHVEYLVHHVREKQTLSLEEAVHKMSGQPADRFGLRGRGSLREGSYADVVVFDFSALDSSSSFEHPAVYPDGIDIVMVNGQLVVDHGRQAVARPGRVLSLG